MSDLFLDAVEYGKLPALKALLKGSPEVLEPSNEPSLYEVAVSSGQLEVLKMLFSSYVEQQEQMKVDRPHCDDPGADKTPWMYYIESFLHEYSRFHSPLIHLAVAFEQGEMVRYLLQKFPDLIRSREPVDGREPLHIAAMNDSISMVEFLVSFGSHVDCTDDHGVTPLLLACERGNSEIVGKLLDWKANLDVRDFNGMGPVHLVVREGHVHLLNQVVRKSTLEAVDNNGYTPLHLAVVSGCVDRVQELLKVYDLLEIPYDMDRVSKDGWTVLHEAASCGQHELCKVLLENGASANVTDSDGNTPLHLAVYKDSVETVHVLLEHGADGNAMSADGETPLLVAAMGGHRNASDIIKDELVQVGKADVNLCNPKSKITPLIQAAAEGHKNIVITLLQLGADPRARTSDRTTALHMAAMCGDETIMFLLLETGKCPVDERDVQGATALHYAVKFWQPACVSALLEFGADSSRIPSGTWILSSTQWEEVDRRDVYRCFHLIHEAESQRRLRKERFNQALLSSAKCIDFGGLNFAVHTPLQCPESADTWPTLYLLKGCRLSRFPDRFKDIFPHIHVLDLSGNRLKRLPSEIGALPVLERLIMDRNWISALDITPLVEGPLRTTLKHISFQQNNIECLPSRLDELESVESLNLSRNYISSIRIRDLPLSLHAFNASHNSLIQCDVSSAPSFPKLIEVQINGNSKLRISVQWIQQLFAVAPALRRLDVEHAVVYCASASGGSSSVQSNDVPAVILNVSNCGLVPAPANSASPPKSPTSERVSLNLKLLADCNGRLKKLFAVHSNIETVIIPRVLSSAPENMRTDVLYSGLKELYLSRNLISVLPADFYRLRGLTVLDMSYNELTALPLHIGKMTRLEVLRLEHNDLKQLPSSLADLHSLAHLNLAHNSIDFGAVADVLVDLRNLRYLNLSHNHLEALPSAAGFMWKTLKVFKYEGNKFTSIPIEVKYRGLKTLLGYLRDLYVDTHVRSESERSDVHKTSAVVAPKAVQKGGNSALEAEKAAKQSGLKRRGTLLHAKGTSTSASTSTLTAGPSSSPFMQRIGTRATTASNVLALLRSAAVHPEIVAESRPRPSPFPANNTQMFTLPFTLLLCGEEEMALQKENVLSLLQELGKREGSGFSVMQDVGEFISGFGMKCAGSSRLGIDAGVSVPLRMLNISREATIYALHRRLPMISNFRRAATVLLWRAPEAVSANSHIEPLHRLSKWLQTLGTCNPNAQVVIVTVYPSQSKGNDVLKRIVRLHLYHMLNCGKSLHRNGDNHVAMDRCLLCCDLGMDLNSGEFSRSKVRATCENSYSDQPLSFPHIIEHIELEEIGLERKKKYRKHCMSVLRSKLYKIINKRAQCQVRLPHPWIRFIQIMESQRKRMISSAGETPEKYVPLLKYSKFTELMDDVMLGSHHTASKIYSPTAHSDSPMHKRLERFYLHDSTIGLLTGNAKEFVCVDLQWVIAAIEYMLEFTDTGVVGGISNGIYNRPLIPQVKRLAKRSKSFEVNSSTGAISALVASTEGINIEDDVEEGGYGEGSRLWGKVKTLGALKKWLGPSNRIAPEAMLAWSRRARSLANDYVHHGALGASTSPTKSIGASSSAVSPMGSMFSTTPSSAVETMSASPGSEIHTRSGQFYPTSVSHEVRRQSDPAAAPNGLEAVDNHRPSLKSLHSKTSPNIVVDLHHSAAAGKRPSILHEDPLGRTDPKTSSIKRLLFAAAKNEGLSISNPELRPGYRQSAPPPIITVAESPSSSQTPTLSREPHSTTSAMVKMPWDRYRGNTKWLVPNVGVLGRSVYTAALKPLVRGGSRSRVVHTYTNALNEKDAQDLLKGLLLSFEIVLPCCGLLGQRLGETLPMTDSTIGTPGIQPSRLTFATPLDRSDTNATEQRRASKLLDQASLARKESLNRTLSFSMAKKYFIPGTTVDESPSPSHSAGTPGSLPPDEAPGSPAPTKQASMLRLLRRRLLYIRAMQELSSSTPKPAPLMKSSDHTGESHESHHVSPDREKASMSLDDSAKHDYIPSMLATIPYKPQQWSFSIPESHQQVSLKFTLGGLDEFPQPVWGTIISSIQHVFFASGTCDDHMFVSYDHIVVTLLEAEYDESPEVENDGSAATQIFRRALSSGASERGEPSDAMPGEETPSAGSRMQRTMSVCISKSCTSTDIDVAIRSTDVMPKVWIVHDCIDSSLKSFPGLVYDCFVVCPECVLDCHPNPAMFEFRHVFGTLNGRNRDKSLTLHEQLQTWHAQPVDGCTQQGEGHGTSIHEVPSECPRDYTHNLLDPVDTLRHGIIPSTRQWVQCTGKKVSSMLSFCGLDFHRCVVALPESWRFDWHRKDTWFGQRFALHVLCESPNKMHFVPGAKGIGIDNIMTFMAMFGPQVFTVLKSLKGVLDRKGLPEECFEAARMNTSVQRLFANSMDDVLDGFPSLMHHCMKSYQKLNPRKRSAVTPAFLEIREYLRIMKAVERLHTEQNMRRIRLLDGSILWLCSACADSYELSFQQVNDRSEAWLSSLKVIDDQKDRGISELQTYLLENMSYAEWDVQDVCNWAANVLGTDEYRAHFAASEVSGVVLVQMERWSLQFMRITNKDHQDRLLEGIEYLKQQSRR